MILAKDGVTVDLAGGVAKITGKVEAGLVYVDGQTVGRATEDTLKERRLLREGGIITVLALVDPTTNRLAEPLEFLTRGFVHDDHTFDGASGEVEKALERAAGEKVAGRRAARAAHRGRGQPVHPADLPPRAGRHRDRRRRVARGDRPRRGARGAGRRSPVPGAWSPRAGCRGPCAAPGPVST